MTHRTRLAFLILAVLTALLASATLYDGLAGPPEPERVPDGTEVALLAALDRGVPAEWVLQTAWLESRFTEGLIGGAGECTQWQLHPRWNKGACELTPHDAAMVAVNLLAKYRRMYVTWEMARMAYMSPVAAAKAWGKS